MGKKNPITQQRSAASPKSLLNESDRGCVILATSILDEALRQIHEVCLNVNLIDDQQEKFLTGEFGPLRSFGGKITLAYVYGLISKFQYEALNIVRELRNEAAHEYFEFKLSDKGVAREVDKLAAFAEINVTLAPDEKTRFVLSALGLHLSLRDKVADGIEKLLEARKKQNDAKAVTNWVNNLPPIT